MPVFAAIICFILYPWLLVSLASDLNGSQHNKGLKERSIVCSGGFNTGWHKSGNFPYMAEEKRTIEYGNKSYAIPDGVVCERKFRVIKLSSAEVE